ncbi:MAG: response regulator [bacterium]
MNTLVVDDDFLCRKLLQKILSPYGECDIAVNGEEALSAFEIALNEESPYNLICLDIMMPNLDGQETLKRIRQIESERGIGGLDGVKIIMVTALKDGKNILGAFKAGCETYIIKPITREKILTELEKLRLIATGIQ